jgi:hypothetical protein
LLWDILAVFPERLKWPIKGEVSAADFSMRRIEILRLCDHAQGVSMNLDHKYRGGLPMKSEYPCPPMPSYREELHAPSSRLTDEKISDDSGAETKIDSALKPAGLKNPFWK